jgi:hypothetical protein
MKLLHQATPDVVLALENQALRREKAQLRDELTSVRRELEAAHAARSAKWADMDDVLDLASTYALAAQAERLRAVQTWPWEQRDCHDKSPLTVDQSRVVMQQHRRCLTGECQVRTTAVRTLRDAGHLTPDASRRSPIPD